MAILKNLVLYYITSVSSVYLMTRFLTGVKAESTFDILVIAFFITFGVWLSSYFARQITKHKFLLFFIFGTVINFFLLYLVSLIIPSTTVTSGYLKFIDIPSIDLLLEVKIDNIMTLLLASAISMGIAAATLWCVTGPRKTA
ncbi:hypothetical protein JW710_01195 [Candidatus Dojkabacteria bacterium]|nr:hypothetical protein [Candidatus Dojkabacteria bacterium]